MKNNIIAGIMAATFLSTPLASVAFEPTKVLLARTSTSVSESVVRSTLLQMNTTMGNSGLGSRDFVSADSFLGIPVVDFVPSCSYTDPVNLLDCLEDALETRRNSVNADIVVAVVPVVGTLCGAVPPGMINAPNVSSSNERLAYAVLKQSCITAPSNNMKIASHEVGHLLSLEHHDSDPATSLPLGIPHNHAEEDFDDHTVMGSPEDDCISTSINCNGHDFLSEVGRTFPDGGSAGNASESNAKAVVSAVSWDVVSAYRPIPQLQACNMRWEFTGCNGPVGVGIITATLPGYTVTNADYDASYSGGPWIEIFEGILSCPSATQQTNMIVRAILSTLFGVSECSMAIPVTVCDGQINPF
jgi:hypothetical protein